MKRIVCPACELAFPCELSVPCELRLREFDVFVNFLSNFLSHLLNYIVNCPLYFTLHCTTVDDSLFARSTAKEKQQYLQTQRKLDDDVDLQSNTLGFMAQFSNRLLDNHDRDREMNEGM